MHLVGFIIEIYYDARPYERQTLFFCRNNNEYTLRLHYLPLIGWFYYRNILRRMTL